MKYFQLHKSQKVLREGTRLYRRRGKELTPERRRDLEEHLEKLDHAIVARDHKSASDLASTLKSKLKIYFPKTTLHVAREFISALLFAILFALFIRELWFELYEVPTGSMRPTIEELDRLVVSKTRFGLHLPFTKDLLFYRDDYLQRAESIVFTVEDMDVADSDTRYFYLIPGKKRFVKRCLGKPGDTVYFYGGLVYGIDKDGKPFKELADENYLKKIGIERIDHIPYITNEGRVHVSDVISRGIYKSARFSQMNIPVARLRMIDDFDVRGEFFNGEKWSTENLVALKSEHSKPEAYSDLWGIGNYAMTRLLSREEVKSFYPDKFNLDKEASLFLELRHTPNLTSPKPKLQQGETGKVFPALSTQTAILPLRKEHLEKIQKAMITARFFVKNGRAYRYHEGSQRPQPPEYDPKFSQVPDGLYEFYYGQGYSVGFGGILSKLPENHPLYERSTENIKRLFNFGFNFNTLFAPVSADQPFLPQRFAYYRNGDFYLMGAPILLANDPTLIQFVENERERQNESTDRRPYIAFIDRGAPLKNGSIDSEFIRNFGLKIPETSVLALGDNFAMSADSRDFGFVPIKNLRGAPSFIFWPFGKRFGALPQPSSPWLTLPNLLVWISALLIFLAWLIYILRRHRKPYFRKIH